MFKSRALLGMASAFGVAALFACSSSSGGGGSGGGGNNCKDVSGSWSMSGNCPSAPSTCTVTQQGCTATLSCDTGSAQAAVNGGNMTFTYDGAQCSGSITNGTFSGSCSTSGGSCTVGGSCSGGSCGTQQVGAGGTTGEGGSSGNGGGPPGGAGGASGSGGSGGGNCGGTLWSSTPACQSCMESSCCSQLQACAPGTPCDQLVTCFATFCAEAPDPGGCLQTNCANELASGGPGIQAAGACEDASCASVCATEGE